MIYKSKGTGTCPHCRLSVRFEKVNVDSGSGGWPSDQVLMRHSPDIVSVLRVWGVRVVAA